MKCYHEEDSVYYAFETTVEISYYYRNLFALLRRIVSDKAHGVVTLKEGAKTEVYDSYTRQKMPSVFFWDSANSFHIPKQVSERIDIQQVVDNKGWLKFNLEYTTALGEDTQMTELVKKSDIESIRFKASPITDALPFYEMILTDFTDNSCKVVFRCLSYTFIYNAASDLDKKFQVIERDDVFTCKKQYCESLSWGVFTDVPGIVYFLYNAGIREIPSSPPHVVSYNKSILTKLLEMKMPALVVINPKAPLGYEITSVTEFTHLINN